MSFKTRFIVNPHSGHNRRRPWLAGRIREYAARRSLDADVELTCGPRHATELAREAVNSDCHLVVAVGGDGTINEVAQAVAGTNAVLGIVPCGSGNGLARHLGLPASMTAALRLVEAGGRIATIDSGLVDDRPFFNAMGFGFDAEVSRRFNGLTRRGLPNYLRAGLGVFRDRKPARYHITTESGHEVFDALLVTIANSEQYGNGARIAPGARVDDGVLDLVAVKPVNASRLAPLVPRLFLGTLHRSGIVVRLRAASFVVERATPGIVHTDGETHTLPAIVTVRVNPRNLRVLVPPRPHTETAAAEVMATAMELP